MPSLSSILSALSDLVFKFIFGTEERKELLRELVNIVLARVGLPLAAKLTLRNPFNLKQFEGDKESILDIGATDETGRMFDIEVQLSSQRSYGSRALYYWSRQYSAQLPEAGKYESLHPVVGIHLVDFVLHKDKPHFLKVYRPVDVLDPNQNEESVLSQDEVAVILELPLMDRGNDCGRLEKILQLLESEGGDQAMVDSLVEQDKIFAEIDEAYRKFTADPELRYIYEARLKARLDRNSMMGEARDDGKAEGLAEGEEIGIGKGRIIGIAEGKAETEIEHARRLKALNIGIDIITAVTGLSPEEIGKL